ncbi:MAG: A/G-specific adenine glycosylase [Acidobacteriota bacterium]|nr:A/G-specific adenine glycosylase [Acidobacteriota bacterium]
MLQQTRMEVVLTYFARFLERFPTLEALAAASEHDVVAAWSGLGYYRRARMLRAGAVDVVERFGGTIPQSVAELLTISGIGRYTAGAIASVAFDTHAPIVDGNVARIVARLFALEPALGTPALQREAWVHAEALVDAARSPRMLNQGLMELGAMICTPRKPACLLCPVREHCLARATGRVDELPHPKAKAVTRELRIPLYIVTDRQGRVLFRLESGALMNAMYHLPHGDTSLLPGTPLAVERTTLLGTVRHTVTTRKITFEVWKAVAVRPRGREYRFILPSELAGVPHPSYVEKALALLQSRKA